MSHPPTPPTLVPLVSSLSVLPMGGPSGPPCPSWCSMVSTLPPWCMHLKIVHAQDSALYGSCLYSCIASMHVYGVLQEKKYY